MSSHIHHYAALHKAYVSRYEWSSQIDMLDHKKLETSIEFVIFGKNSAKRLLIPSGATNYHFPSGKTGKKMLFCAAARYR